MKHTFLNKWKLKTNSILLLTLCYLKKYWIMTDYILLKVLHLLNIFIRIHIILSKLLVFRFFFYNNLHIWNLLFIFILQHCQNWNNVYFFTVYKYLVITAIVLLSSHNITIREVHFTVGRYVFFDKNDLINFYFVHLEKKAVWNKYEIDINRIVFYKRKML